MLEELHKLLLELANILKKESEQNWIRAINQMLKKIESALSDGYGHKEAISYVHKTYEAINSGNGSFSDFHIWRDNLADRKRENEHLDKNKRSILELLNKE